MADLVGLRFRTSWADEFDLDGLMIVDKAWWEEHQVHAKQCRKWPKEVGFGTNEDMIYDDAEDYLKCFHELPATQEELVILKRLVGNIGVTAEIDFEDDDFLDDDWPDD